MIIKPLLGLLAPVVVLAQTASTGALADRALQEFRAGKLREAERDFREITRSAPPRTSTLSFISGRRFLNRGSMRTPLNRLKRPDPSRRTREFFRLISAEFSPTNWSSRMALPDSSTKCMSCLMMLLRQIRNTR